MKKEELVRETVRIFSYLYSVVVALSLTTAIRFLIGGYSPFSIPRINVIMFLTFLATVIPFYHGALMFLIRTYIEEVETKKRGELLFDFVILLTEGIFMFALSESLLEISSYIGWLYFLMVLDSFWVILVYLKSMKHSYAPKYWAILNLVMVVFLYCFGYYTVANEELYYFLLFIFSLIRTILDYALCYKYYFPTTTK